MRRHKLCVVHYVLSMGFLSSVHTNVCVQSLHIEFGHYTRESHGHVQISAVMGTNFMAVVECVTLILLAAVLCHGNRGLARRLGQKIGLLEGSWAIRKFIMVWVCMSQGEAMSLVNWCLARNIKKEQATSSDDHA